VKIINVVGARPNFMKMAPIIEALNHHPDRFQQTLVHTGQHYDEPMSKVFFDDLGMPRPDIDLEVGSASHAEQTARIMMAFEPVCLDKRPDLVIIVGDVNSTLACALTAKKLGIAVAHVEAGLRSRDMTMPEEINRICTDAIADLLFTTDRQANENLGKEGIPAERIHFVGNVMIDTLERHRAAAANLSLIEDLSLTQHGFAVVTLHRPSNVDDKATFQRILEALQEISKNLPIILPMHPRTRMRIEEFGLNHLLGNDDSGIATMDPLGYLEFLHLTMNARLVLTDSGGLQEETTVLGVPCLTLRPNTERPITCTQGTNQVVGNSKTQILEAARSVLDQPFPNSRAPEKWDGRAAERIVEVLLQQ
jgi:UDP-N-acetylglucosamine 2-epimerase (non-hydrolysing)